LIHFYKRYFLPMKINNFLHELEVVSK